MSDSRGLQNTIKIGILFFAALVLFAVMIFKIKDFDPFETGNTFVAVFDSIYGIETGSLVKIGGVPVGEVRNIGFQNNRVKVVMFVEKEAPIRKDSVASIKMDNLFGGYFIAISPGSPEYSLLHGGPIQTEHKMQPTDVIDEVGKISEKIGALVQSFDQNQQQLMDELNNLVSENREKIDQSIDNIQSASENIATTVENIREIVDKLQRGEGTVGKLIQEEEIYQQAQEITDNMQTLSRDTREMVERNQERIDRLILNLDESAKSIRQITEQVQSGQGAVGTLIYDEEVSEQTKQVLESFSQPAKMKVLLGFDPYYDSRQGEADFEAYLKLEPRPSKYYMARFSNIATSDDDPDTDDLEVDILIAYKFFNNHLVLRGGAIRSSGGFGIDYETLDGDLTLGTSIYDFSENSTAVDIRLDFFFYHGFFFKGELVDIFDDGEYRAGLGFEFEDKDLRYLIGLVGLR